MKTKVFFTLIMLLIIGSLFAQHEKLMADIDAKYKDAKTFEADIHQSVSMGYIDMQVDSIGKIYLSGGVFALEYTSPTHQFIRYADGEVTLYMAEENVAMITRIPENAKNDLFNPADLLGDNMDYQFLREEDGLVVFRLSDPENPRADVQIYIDQRDSLLVKLTSDLGSGEQTVIELKNQRFNQPLTKDPNDFQIPENAVINRY